MAADPNVPTIKPLLTIVICTYDRHDLLIKTLSNLETIALIEQCEVIIVDNTDDPKKREATRRVCIAKFPRFKVTESKTPGLSLARNVGLSHAQADVIAYLDDDAVPCHEWADALIRSFRNEDIVFAGGPIDPDWEITPPDWLPEEIFGAFTVLDLGKKSRTLDNGEFVYGANMAFQTALLREIGGFDEHLGRVKTNLHGEEDIAVQRKLSKFGKGFYAKQARVKHFIPSARINWNWLVKRFAWQGFSEFSHHPTMQNFHLRALDAMDNNPIASQFYNGLFQEPTTKRDAIARLNVIRSVLGNLFQGRDDVSLFKKPIAPQQQIHPSPLQHMPNGAPNEKLSRHALSSHKPIFVEFGMSHSYLMKSFGDIGSFEFVNPQFNPWTSEFKAVSVLHQMREEINCEDYRIFFLTLDWLLFNKRAVYEIEKIPSAGILHRIHDNAIAIANLKRLALTTRIVAFSEDVADWVYSSTGTRCLMLPHPPLFFKNTLSGSIPAQRMKHAQRRTNRKWNITLLGEVRSGKGYEAIIKSLGQNDMIRSRFSLNLGGGGQSRKVNEIKELAKSVNLEINLRVEPHREHDFRGIDDVEFSNLIEDSDIMLFPYHGEEAHSMSGHFVDSVFAGCRLLVSNQSTMAHLTNRYRLGGVFDIQDGNSLCSKLLEEMHRENFSSSDNEAALEFQNHYSTQACVDILERIMKL